MQTISISGLKLSGPMAALILKAPVGPGDLFAELCSLLSEAGINITFAVTSAIEEAERSLCCIAFQDLQKMESVVALNQDVCNALVCLPPVGILSFFPHGSSFKVLGEALDCLAKQSIDVHGFASSISALSFVIDFGRLEEAASALTHSFQLPENHCPFKSDRTVRQVMPSL